MSTSLHWPRLARWNADRLWLAVDFFHVALATIGLWISGLGRAFDGYHGITPHDGKRLIALASLVLHRPR